MKTLNELLDFRAQAHSNRTALVFEDCKYSYFEMNRQANRMARALVNLNLKQGDRFAVLDYNSPCLVHLFHAAIKMGSIPIMLNWRSTKPELKYILQDCDAKILIASDEFEKIIQELSLEIPVFKIQQLQKQAVELKDDNFSITNKHTSEDDVFIQLYTSGTTGHAKGVLLTHRNMMAMTTALSTEIPGQGADSIVLVAGPFFNIAGCGVHMLGLRTGAKNIIMPRFDPLKALQIISKYKVTYAFLAPAMMQMMLEIYEPDEYDLSSLRNIQYGGSVISESLLRRAVDVFNCDFTQAYGLTESCGIATLLRYDDHRRMLAPKASIKEQNMILSAGKAAPGMQFVIKSVENKKGQIAKNNEEGEILIRGDFIFKGYWKKENENAKCFTKEGWYHTGDIGKIDADGYLYIVDRKTDTIVSRGMNIYPAEVERVLRKHPDIKDLCVIGIPDLEFGEAVLAIIILAGIKKPDIKTIQDWCRNDLASYKMPKKLKYVDVLPLNASGKVLRAKLREPYWRGQERRV